MLPSGDRSQKAATPGGWRFDWKEHEGALCIARHAMSRSGNGYPDAYLLKNSSSRMRKISRNGAQELISITEE